MPSVKQKLPPDSNVTLEPQQPHAPYTNLIYYALAAVVVILLFRFLLGRLSTFLPSWARGLGRIQRRGPNSLKDSKSFPVFLSATTGDTNTSHTPFHHLAGFEKEAQTLWRAGLLPTPAGQVRTGGLTASVLGMEEQQRDGTGSRGVSRSSAGSKPRVLSSHADAGSRKASRSPRSVNKSKNSPCRGHSNSSDGSTEAKRKGKGLMDDHSWGGTSSQDSGYHVVDGEDSTVRSGYNDTEDYGHGASMAIPRFSRPPQPPPLTPPTLSTAVFAFQDRRPNYAVSISPDLDVGFIHQPNPDYMASSTLADYEAVENSLPKSTMAATTVPRRRAYTRTVPLDIPTPSRSNSSPHQSQEISWGTSSTDGFSPASYPPSSPHLPPPPPESFERIVYDYDGDEAGEMELQGEIISALDDAGHGWKRHTRVYGGGVCLACAGSGGKHGGGGGFYGPKVPLSERR